MSFRETRRGGPERWREPGSQVTPGRVAAVASLILVGVVTAVILAGSGPHKNPATPTSTTPASTHGQTAASTSSTTPSPGTTTVPILVYHVINAQPTGSSASAAIYVPADQFSSQMQALKANGWHAVTLDQLQAYWTHGASLGPGKPIVLSFDNGYASHYTNALPVLKGLGWVGVENLQLTGLPSSEGGLTDTQIRGLLAAGWELDTQGLSHVDLTAVGPTQLTAEVSTARQTLHSQYGVPVNWFCYPFGDYNPTVIAAVKAAGYAGATTVNPGWASPSQDRFRLPRIAVTAGTSPSQLLAQIASAQSATSIPPSFTGVGIA